jgi:Uma2 family endonuclease
VVLHTVAKGVLLSPDLDWLPDDTAESLLGSMLHQRVIVSEVNSLTRYSKRENLGWKIGNQLRLVIPRASGERSYQPSPDILVHTSPSLGERAPSLNVNVFGPPALAIEICSPSTAQEHDLDTVNPRAKPRAYAQAGIPEYLAFDPTGEIVREFVRAWRMGESGEYDPWLPDPATGRWHSALGISFAPQGVLLRVYDADGNIVPDNDDMDELLTALEAERARERAERDAQLAARDARIAELEAELRRQRGE